jgi:uncharacterized protein YhbP (UPF0306 family)
MDFYDQNEIIEYSLKLKSFKEKLAVPIDKNKLKLVINEFLSSHNTCTLATCHLNSVRSTPIEYNYLNGHLYLLSEGGEKFANLLLNNNVSVSIYEDYTGMNTLKGMQIKGYASLIEDDEEYDSVLKFKGLNIDLIRSMPVKINMIKITIDKIEFLNSKFKIEGADTKQIINF